MHGTEGGKVPVPVFGSHCCIVSWLLGKLLKFCVFEGENPGKKCRTSSYVSKILYVLVLGMTQTPSSRPGSFSAPSVFNRVSSCTGPYADPKLGEDLSGPKIGERNEPRKFSKNDFFSQFKKKLHFQWNEVRVFDEKLNHSLFEIDHSFIELD